MFHPKWLPTVAVVLLTSTLWPAPAGCQEQETKPVSPNAGAAPPGIVYPGDLIPVYASALRHFEGRLTETQATALAREIIDQSRKQALDARLLVAVVSVEGLLAHAGSGQGGPLLRGRPAAAALQELAADLGRRITRAADSTRDADEAIRVALLDRAAHKLSPRDRKAQTAYQKQVVERYRQLCGEGQ